MLVTFCFTACLIPILIDCMKGNSVNPYASIITGIGLLDLFIMYVTLNMYLASIANLTNGIIWLAIAFYSFNNRVPNSKPNYNKKHHGDL